MKKAPKGTTRGVFVVDKTGKVLAAEAGSPAGTVDVVKALVMDMGAGGDATQAVQEAQNKLVAETAAEVANTAAALDKSKTSTPLPA
jgi:peroxiredoxin Q/BCP